MSDQGEVPHLEELFNRSNPPRRVLVNSIPKSGTTWVRTMMAMLPGYTEYPREGVSGIDAEQLLDVAPGQVFHGHIVSSERLFDIMETMGFATVFVYRDLRDVVVSDYYHRAALNPKRAPAIFAELPKEELLRPAALWQWSGSVKRYPDVKVWIDRGFPTVRYEDLKLDTAGELGRIFEEMGFVVPPGLTASIAERASFQRQSGRRPGEEDASSPLRKGIVGDWRNHLGPEIYDEFLEEFGDLLVDYGYDIGDR